MFCYSSIYCPSAEWSSNGHSILVFWTIEFCIHIQIQSFAQIQNGVFVIFSFAALPVYRSALFDVGMGLFEPWWHRAIVVCPFLSPNLSLSEPIRPIADQMAHVRRVVALACLVTGYVKIFFVFAQALHDQFIWRDSPISVTFLQLYNCMI